MGHFGFDWILAFNGSLGRASRRNFTARYSIKKIKIDKLSRARKEAKE
jgi:hypothetical protein